MGIIKKLYHTTPVGETDLNKQEVYPISATPAIYSPVGADSFPNRTLDQIIDSLNEGYQYVGLATQSTVPGTFDHKVYYLASEPGTYSHFGNIVVSGLTVIRNTSSNTWTADSFNITAGGGGSSVVTGYIGTTPVQTISSVQFLDGISQIRLVGDPPRIYFGVGSSAPYIEYNQYGFHFSHGLYSDDFVTAGGINGTGGGGGGSMAAWSNYDDTAKIVTLTIDGVAYTLCVNGYAAGGGGGGGITTETDPIFTSHPAYGITSQDITNWNNASSGVISLVEGTGITITTSGSTKTISLSSTYQNAISTLQSNVSTLQGNVLTLQSYFTGTAANNALALNGHADTYFATASGLSSLSADVSAIANRVTAIEGWFEIDQNGDLHVKNNRGLYSDSFISAGGINSSGGGGGTGVSYLKFLDDVYHTSDVLRANGYPAQNGDFLVYTTSLTSPVRWAAKAIDSTLIINALGYTPYNATNPNGYGVGTITGITMNGVSKGTSGVVDLGTVLTNDSGFVHKTGNETIAGNKTFQNIATFRAIVCNGQEPDAVQVVAWDTIYATSDQESLQDALNAKQDCLTAGVDYVQPSTLNNYLPLTGGTLANTQTDILCLKNTSSNNTTRIVIKNSSSNVELGAFEWDSFWGASIWTKTVSGDLAGALGVLLDGTPYYAHPDNGGVYYKTLLHTGNWNSIVSLDLPSISGTARTDNINNFFQTPKGNYRGQFQYYACAVRGGTDGNPSNVVGINGFPAANDANALLTIGTYDDGTNIGVYQIGLSSDDNIYYRRGNGASPLNGVSWKKLIYEDSSGDLNITRDIISGRDVIIPYTGKLFLDSTRDVNATPNIHRGNILDNDYSLYITAGKNQNNGNAALYIYSGGLYIWDGDLLPGRPWNSQTAISSRNLGSNTHYWNNMYVKRWYPDINNAPNAYIEWDSSNQAFIINGPVYSTGQISAGGIISNS